jgi:hypothetical protein
MDFCMNAQEIRESLLGARTETVLENVFLVIMVNLAQWHRTKRWKNPQEKWKQMSGNHFLAYNTIEKKYNRIVSLMLDFPRLFLVPRNILTTVSYDELVYACAVKSAYFKAIDFNIDGLSNDGLFMIMYGDLECALDQHHRTQSKDAHSVSASEQAARVNQDAQAAKFILAVRSAYPVSMDVT